MPSEIITGPPTPRQRLFASLFGYTAYFIGLVLVVAIFHSLIFFSR
ncbi:MAG: hypothetical protein ABW250_20035 [Pyrinomonadaceae bacterium]